MRCFDGYSDTTNCFISYLTNIDGCFGNFVIGSLNADAKIYLNFLGAPGIIRRNERRGR